MSILARFTPSDPDSQYGYIPSEGGCIAFVVLFSILTILHMLQAVQYRLWWILPTICLAGLGEIIGWVGRLWSSFNPNALNPFLMQITSTIIAPTPLVAALFVTLGLIIGRLGPRYSRLTPKWYTIIFCSCDIIALVVQAVGGAKASSAASNGTSATAGGNIMLGGIVFQMAAITVYIILATEFLVRYARDLPIHAQDAPRVSHMPRNIRLMVIGLYISTLFTYIRSVYRTIELAGGWSGRVIQTQWPFNVFDGAMIVLAMLTLNIFHPGRLLGKGVSLRDSVPELDNSDMTQTYTDKPPERPKEAIEPSEGSSIA